MNGEADLGDVAWGDVISDDDGVLVVRGQVDDLPVVVKRFTDPSAREVSTYALLERLGVPTLPVLGSGPDWIILEDLTSAGYRQASADDLADPDVARLIARWYDHLHGAGDALGSEAIEYSEFDLIDDEGLSRVAARWPDLADAAAWAAGRLPAWRQELSELPHTLTYNDFWSSNLAISWDGSSALMFDHNLTGMGLRASDLRNVTLALSPVAAEAFLTQYRRLCEARGAHLLEAAFELDAATAHLVALIMASEFDETPAWAGPSIDWARTIAR